MVTQSDCLFSGKNGSLCSGNTKEVIVLLTERVVLCGDNTN